MIIVKYNVYIMDIHKYHFIHYLESMRLNDKIKVDMNNQKICG